ncbi:MAG: hypothetical protein ABFE07_09205 [Armatimonadia bacterium]
MLHWLLASILMATPTGQLTVNTPDLEATMTARAGWTITEVNYQGAKMIMPAGGQGAVYSVGGTEWIGSVNGDTEKVSTFTVKGDNIAAETLTGDNKPPVPYTVTGNKIETHKESTLQSVKHIADTTFEKDLIIQRHQFEFTEEIRPVSFYAFIYSFNPEAKNWLARPLEGDLLRGEFSADGGQKPTRSLRWLAQYDPATQKGAIAYFPQPPTGRGFVTFWDQKNYHKLFAQPLSGTIPAGTKLDLPMVVQFFSATPEAWEQQAQTVAKGLETRFPQTIATGPATPAQPKVYGEGVPEDGLLTLKTAKFTVPMSARQAWTIYKIEYNGKELGHQRGFYGTVMVPKGGKFWGTGHTEGGAEVVHSLKLTVDGKEQPIKVDTTVTGSKLTIEKESTIWKFKCHSEVTVTDDNIFERTRLEATEDLELSLLYYFMHCFVPTTTKWIAQLPDDTFIEGVLDSNEDKGVPHFEVNKDTRWVAQYEPNMNLGILCYTPKVISGPGSRAMIWDLARYHKFYYQANTARAMKAGETLDYNVIVKPVQNETGDWTATKAAAAELAKQYPPVD